MTLPARLALALLAAITLLLTPALAHAASKA